MSTPLYTALQEFQAAHPLRMAMPGHKGQPLPALADYAGIDFTELPPTGNLYAPGGPIEAAEQLWAEVWGADCCLFLTGGSTQGVHTMLLRAAGPGEEILVDRVSHRSIHTGMALLDLRPVWLARPWLAEAGVVGPVEPDCVKAVLEAHPNIKTVCITSPTYYGVLSDIPAISHICHAHGAKLLVDGAHGAHLFLTGENPYRGADYVVTSAHKTLRAPGQSALLFANAPETLDGLRRASRTFASSSPSYPMMAALDWAREYYCEGQGQARYRETCAAVEHRTPGGNTHARGEGDAGGRGGGWGGGRGGGWG
ncbi:MAG: aminotransferase class V-fold PLP-dependent enzyme, partial [Oscillospiraceae bacterium]|nr:aminotransferase class V-fold PLP-dependent enzyme [Oscillospiraceae bacterium]